MITIDFHSTIPESELDLLPLYFAHLKHLDPVSLSTHDDTIEPSLLDQRLSYLVKKEIRRCV